MARVQGSDLVGIFERLTDPTDPTAVADFDEFAAVHAGGIDGLWANTLQDVSVVVGPDYLRAIGSDFPDCRIIQGRAERG